MNYLTPAGFRKLKTELNHLMDEERPNVVAQVSAAAALGDRSENADYIYGKRRLREIDRRIHFLGKRLEDVEVIDPEKINPSKVVFAAWVKIRDEDEKMFWYQIVGQDEIDPTTGKITFSSPLGKAMLGKSVGDFITFEKPNTGPSEYEIIDIRASLEKPKI